MFRILWVTPQFPCIYSGGQARQYHLLRYLCQKHSVTVLSLIQKNEIREIQELLDLGVEVITEVFHPSTINGKWGNRIQSWSQILFDPWPNFARTYPISILQNHLSNILVTKKPDIVHIEGLFSAHLVKTIKHIPCVLTEQNVESLNYDHQRRLTNSVPRRLSGWIESQKLFYWERKMLLKHKACIAVSEDDACYLQDLVPHLSLYIIPNGVDASHFSPPDGKETQRKGLLFFGNLGYRPNIDSLIFFVQEIFPAIKVQAPEVKLRIVGPNALPVITAMDGLPGIEFIGFVEDIRPYLWQAQVCIVPLRSGGGTRLKILEALAAGCPVVSTSIGAEGLDLIDGQDLCIADDPENFANTALMLLEDPNQQERLRKTGQQTVTQKYDWGIIAPRLELVYESVIEDFRQKQ